MTNNTYIFDKLITIPETTIFYRGVSGGKHMTDEQILRPGKPIYIASEDIASAYCRNPENDRCVQFITTDNLKLLDLRKIISLLPFLLHDIEPNNNNNNLTNILKITLGISSLDEQIELLDNYKTIFADNYKRIITYKKWYSNSCYRFRCKYGCYFI
jgi:hypothetical protein